MKLKDLKPGQHFAVLYEARAAISSGQTIRVLRRLSQSSETQPPEKSMVYASWENTLGSFSEDTDVIICAV